MLCLMDLVDAKYIGLISSRLEKFKRVKDNLYNFRCPICGDSQKQRNKARGYLYSVKADINFKCHNCGASMTFSTFLKEVDPVCHKSYIFERFKSGKTGRGYVVETPKFDFDKPVFKKKLSLPLASTNDKASDYLKKRKLNPTKFYYAEKFKSFCNSLKNDSFSSTINDNPRIVIPLYDEEKNLIGIQGRSLNPWDQPKYLTIMLSDDAPKIYGLDTVKKDEKIYIVEGPFDSTFVENSVAMCGSDVDIGSFNWSDYIWVLDNEPRNREILNRICKLIDRGQQVVIWPSDVQEKDINDMILSGRNVQDMIESNTYSGLEAKVKFTNWKKI